MIKGGIGPRTQVDADAFSRITCLYTASLITRPDLRFRLPSKSESNVPELPPVVSGDRDVPGGAEGLGAGGAIAGALDRPDRA